MTNAGTLNSFLLSTITRLPTGLELPHLRDTQIDNENRHVVIIIDHRVSRDQVTRAPRAS